MTIAPIKKREQATPNPRILPYLSHTVPHKKEPTIAAKFKTETSTEVWSTVNLNSIDKTYIVPEKPPTENPPITVLKAAARQHFNTVALTLQQRGTVVLS